MDHYDWKKIKTEYVTSEISLRQLCKKHGISYTSMSRQSVLDKWGEAKKKHKASVVSKAIQKSARIEVNRLANLMTATNDAIDAATKALQDPKQFHRFIVTENVGGGATQTEERIYEKLDTKALRDMTAALKDLTGLMRDFYNIPTPAQAEAQRVAAERLELEKKKNAEADKGSDAVVNVILEGELQEWSR